MYRSFLLALIVAPLLGGCGIPDLVAHTVKAVEKSRRDGSGQAEAQPSAAQSQPAAAAEEPPQPVAAPLPPRSSVTAEELPAR
ncbi:hypothetical protein [Magnetospirillum sp. SS-4]|uniref:hypothetical protein n=1 Tax=Magnetospirillum sp. SS-4 TaxID=2681465 RepID=UPI001381508C|nr:hypothetical protein [Magnetospirillum sp. SS-4]CAA7626314.1 conserved exported hypothetical protein [Magnetospirillum sp. SS-4]